MGLLKKIGNLSPFIMGGQHIYTLHKDQIIPTWKGYSPFLQPCKSDREKGMDG